MEGKAIGINSVILSTTGGNIGIGFAIPSNMARKVIRDLKKEGRVIRGYLGVQITDMSESDAKEFGLSQGGVLVIKVESDTPAEKAGLKKYDLITKINGRSIRSASDLRTNVANFSPGDVIELAILRDNKEMKIKVKVGEAPDSLLLRTDGEEGRSIDLGMVLMNNSPTLARRYDLSTSKGVLVAEVERGGIAYENGLRSGDVVLAINRTEIESVRQFREIMSDKKAGSRVFLAINREGRDYFIRFKIPE
jgi:serine protease Do